MARRSRQQVRGSQTDVLSPADRDGGDDALQVLSKQFETSHQTLQELLDQVADIHGIVCGDRTNSVISLTSGPSAGPWSDEEAAECERLRDQVVDLKAINEDLERQNSDLASQLASRCVESSIAGGHSRSDETLTWEERKQMMLREMENDSFDADAFMEVLSVDVTDEAPDPVRYVEQLQFELDRRDEELRERSQQIHELQSLLDLQSETRDGGIAIGAAAITNMFDADELVREERERLQQMQEEWEDKFRQAEIEASLERAKLSRERQELAKKMSELEEQIAHAKREARHGSSNEEGPSRRWLAKLGLADGNG